jgi:hypothetical protein
MKGLSILIGRVQYLVEDVTSNREVKMSENKNKKSWIEHESIYKYLRIYTILWGAFILLGMIAGVLNPKMTVDYYPPYPSQLEVFLESLPLIIFSLVLLIPHKRFLAKNLYFSKMVVLVIGGGYFLFNGVNGIYRYFYPGGYDLLAIPFSILIALFGIAAPLTLYMKKRLAGQ